MNTKTAAMSIKGVGKKYGKRTVLEDVTLKLYPGKCSLLCGSNGAGKTTFLRILAGLEKPHQGTLNLGEGDQRWNRIKGRLLNTTVYVHHQPYMFEGSVVDNLGYALPRRSKRRRELIEQTLEWASLKPLAKANAKTLSGGEKQRVALARAWLRNPTIMLLDEPTANMDTASYQRTIQLLQQLKSEGVSLMIATHAPESFYITSESRYRLEDGALVNQSPPDYTDAIVPLSMAHRVPHKSLMPAPMQGTEAHSHKVGK